MKQYAKNHTITFEDNVVKFEALTQEVKCEHLQVVISQEDSEIVCKDCNTKLNPVHWIGKHLERLNSISRRNNRMLAEYREIVKRLEKKSSFMCKSCHEVNKIDFTSLPSKAAVERGMSVVDADFDGVKIEVAK